MYFSSNLEWIRKKKNLTQEELAKELGIGQQGIAHYESGKREPTLNGLIRIAKVLEVSIDDLLTKDLRPMGSILSMNLRYLRKRNKYTQEDMTKLLGYKDKSSYCLIENGVTQISVNNLVNIAEFFDITVDDLLKKDLSKEG